MKTLVIPGRDRRRRRRDRTRNLDMRHNISGFRVCTPAGFAGLCASRNDGLSFKKEKNK